MVLWTDLFNDFVLTCNINQPPQHIEKNNKIELKSIIKLSTTPILDYLFMIICFW